MGVPWRVATARGVCRGPFRGVLQGLSQGMLPAGCMCRFQGILQGLMQGLLQGVVHGDVPWCVPGGGVHFRPYCMGRLNGLCRWCCKAVCPSCSYLIRILVLYEHLRKNARIMLVFL